MFVMLALRNGGFHILHYMPSPGEYYSLCANFFNKEDHINTIAIDNIIDGICVNCKYIAESIKYSKLNKIFKSSKYQSYKRGDIFLKNNKKNYIGPKAKYNSLNIRSHVNELYYALTKRSNNDK